MRNEPPSSVFAVSGALRRFSADIGSSAPNLASCPDESLPEFAFIGRSNVGKSSLLNMLAGRPGHGSGRSGRSPRDAFCLQCLQPYPALVSGEIGLGPGGSKEWLNQLTPIIQSYVRARFEISILLELCNLHERLDTLHLDPTNSAHTAQIV